jgi:hypothetical protein
MWVKGTPLHFIVDNGSQKNLISTKVVKWLKLLTTPHPQPYNIRWLSQGRDLCINQQCHMPYAIKPLKDEVLCDVAPKASISLISAKQCRKVITLTGKFVLLMIHSQGEKKVVATSMASTRDSTTQQK